MSSRCRLQSSFDSGGRLVVACFNTLRRENDLAISRLVTLLIIAEMGAELNANKVSKLTYSASLEAKQQHLDTDRLRALLDRIDSSNNPNTEKSGDLTCSPCQNRKRPPKPAPLYKPKRHAKAHTS